MLEEREIEARTNDLDAAMREGVARLRRRRSNRDDVTGRVLAMTGREESDRALMARVRAGFVNALVQLRRSGEKEREKKSADEPRGHERVSGIRFASDETQPHWAGVCSLRQCGARTIWRLTLESSFDIVAGLK